MEMRQLRHFLALMETRSYWRAADSCGITAQALSKSIRRFEEQLGVRLFDRDTRSVRPTIALPDISMITCRDTVDVANGAAVLMTALRQAGRRRDLLQPVAARR